MDAKGYLQTGWVNDGQDEYYVDSDGQALTDRFFEVDGKWVALDDEGRATRKGFATYHGNSYFIRDDGQLAKNCVVEGYRADGDGILTKLQPENTGEFHMTLADAFAQDNFSLMKETYDDLLTPEGQEIFYGAMKHYNDTYLDGNPIEDFRLPKIVMKRKPTVDEISGLIRFHFFMPNLRDSIRPYKEGLKQDSIVVVLRESDTEYEVRIERQPVPPEVLKTIAAGKSAVVNAAMREHGDIARIKKATHLLMDGKVYVLGDDMHNSYNVYHEGKGLCESFAIALTAILNDMGYETYIQTGHIDAYNGEEGHGWTKVKVNHEWWNIDPTSITGGFHDEFILKDDAYLESQGYHFWKCGQH